VRALKAGQHVLCEKPVALSIWDAERIQQAAEASDRMVMIGHVSRYEPDHRAAKDLVEAGQIGDVAMVVHSLTTSLPGWSEGAGWRDRRRSSTTCTTWATRWRASVRAPRTPRAIR
jgi:predicted dehydrogenase